MSVKTIESDPDGNGKNRAYRWYGSADNGNTWSANLQSLTNSYTVRKHDEGKLIKATVSYVDGNNVDEVVETDPISIGKLNLGSADFQIVSSKSGYTTVQQLTPDPDNVEGNSPWPTAYPGLFSNDYDVQWSIEGGAAFSQKW